MKKLLIPILSTSILFTGCADKNENDKDLEKLEKTTISKQDELKNKLYIQTLELESKTLTGTVNLKSTKKSDTDVAGFDYEPNTISLKINNPQFKNNQNQFEPITGDLKDTFIINNVERIKVHNLKNNETVTFVQILDNRRNTNSKNKKFTELSDADVYITSDKNIKTDSKYKYDNQPTITYYIYKTKDYKPIYNKMKQQIINLKEDHVKKYKSEN